MTGSSREVIHPDDREQSPARMHLSPVDRAIENAMRCMSYSLVEFTKLHGPHPFATIANHARGYFAGWFDAKGVLYLPKNQFHPALPELHPAVGHVVEELYCTKRMSSFDICYWLLIRKDGDSGSDLPGALTMLTSADSEQVKRASRVAFSNNVFDWS